MQPPLQGFLFWKRLLLWTYNGWRGNWQTQASQIGRRSSVLHISRISTHPRVKFNLSLLRVEASVASTAFQAGPLFTKWYIIFNNNYKVKYRGVTWRRIHSVNCWNNHVNISCSKEITFISFFSGGEDTNWISHLWLYRPVTYHGNFARSMTV